MVLFAEVDNGTLAVLMALSGVVGTAVTWFTNYLTNNRDKERIQSKADEKTITEHLEAVKERCEKENEELKKEQREITNKLMALTGHVRYLEGIMESKNIKFNRFKPDETDIHKPIVHTQIKEGK